MTAGALDGIRVIELAGIGPGPFAAMMLADHGAEVIRVTRPGAAHEPTDILNRSRRTLTLDLKAESDREVLKVLVRSADALIEGFRPGTMERLGLGPEALFAENPALVYGRMTGWGQQGPLARAAGHDINYIALSGALHCFGRARPLPGRGAGLASASSNCSAICSMSKDDLSDREP
jgi:alpha-methylacyl-CoA racemase